MEAPLNRKRLFTDLSVVYHGPTLGEFGPYSQNAKGEIDPSALSGFEMNMNPAYLLDTERGVGIGPDIWFYYQPNKSGKDQFVLRDLGLKIFDLKTVATGNFKVYTNLFLQAPTSQAAQDVNMNFALRSTPFAFYDVGQTRWRLGVWTDFRYRNGVDTGTVFKAYAQPYFAYRFTDKLIVALGYEMAAQHDVESSGTMTFHQAGTDFLPTISYKIFPNVNLSGFLIYYPEQKLSAETTGVGASLYSQLL